MSLLYKAINLVQTEGGGRSISNHELYFWPQLYNQMAWDFIDCQTNAFGGVRQVTYGERGMWGALACWLQCGTAIQHRLLWKNWPQGLLNASSIQRNSPGCKCHCHLLVCVNQSCVQLEKCQWHQESVNHLLETIAICIKKLSFPME